MSGQEPGLDCYHKMGFMATIPENNMENRRNDTRMVHDHVWQPTVEESQRHQVSDYSGTLDDLVREKCENHFKE
jgi:hypothetical protein